MRKYLIRIACGLVAFAISGAAIRLIRAKRGSSRQQIVAAQLRPLPRPLPRRRVWPEPRDLALELLDADRLAYSSYLVKRLYKMVKVSDGDETSGRAKSVDIEVSYAKLTHKGKVVANFDNGLYHPTGNSTSFGLSSLLGTQTKQLVVSQSIHRGGDHWIVGMDPSARVIFNSSEWGVSGENLRAVDVDYDGIDEILAEVPAFYELQDKLAVSEIPLPEVIFKYDVKARKYLPANLLHTDYLLRDINPADPRVRKPKDDNFNHLAGVLDVTLQLIYAGNEKEGWAFYDNSYQLTDKEQIKARLQADLKSDRVYDFIYPDRCKFEQTAELTLPENMRAALNQKFPGWKPAEVDESIHAFLKESVSPFARPDIMSGDFDGDRTIDYAVLIQQELRVQKARAGRSHEFYLVIFLRPSKGFQMHVLNPEGEYLGLMRRGAWDYDYAIQSFFTYQHDTIFTGIFEKGGSSYIYKNGRFQPIVTSD